MPESCHHGAFLSSVALPSLIQVHTQHHPDARARAHTHARSNTPSPKALLVSYLSLHIPLQKIINRFPPPTTSTSSFMQETSLLKHATFFFFTFFPPHFLPLSSPGRMNGFHRNMVEKTAYTHAHANERISLMPNQRWVFLAKTYRSVPTPLPPPSLCLALPVIAVEVALWVSCSLAGNGGSPSFP